MALDLATDLPTVAPRHHDIEKYQRRLDLVECLQCIIAVVSHGDGITLSLQIVADDVRVIRVVVDYENRRVRCVSHKQLSVMMLWPVAAQFASQPQQ